MAQKDLISLADRTTEERHKLAVAGGKASGKARRNKALLRDCLEILLEKKYENEDGKKSTGAELVAINMFQTAINEKDSAKLARIVETIRDTAGQKLPDKIEQTNTNITIDFGDIDDGN